MQSNAFLLCLASPVLHKMICGTFSEAKSRQLVIVDVDGEMFVTILHIWSGKGSMEGRSLEESIELAGVADRFQMKEVETEIEDSIVQKLNVKTCVDILVRSRSSGLSRIGSEARKFIASHFEAIASTENYSNLDEDELFLAIDDDSLGVSNEAAAFEAVVKWINGRNLVENETMSSHRLFLAIRYGLMDRDYLEFGAYENAPEGCLLWIEPCLHEALKEKAQRKCGDGHYETQHLGPKAFKHRVRPGVPWERYTNGGEARLDGHADCVTSIADCRGAVFTGSLDGTIGIRNSATLEREGLMRDGGGTEAVCALAVWEGFVISGHRGGQVRVWNAPRAACERALQARGDVSALAVAGTRLAVATDDECTQLWRLGPAPAAGRACERELRVDGEWVSALAAWAGRVVAALSGAAGAGVGRRGGRAGGDPRGPRGQRHLPARARRPHVQRVVPGTDPGAGRGHLGAPLGGGGVVRPAADAWLPGGERGGPGGRLVGPVLHRVAPGPALRGGRNRGGPGPGGGGGGAWGGARAAAATVGG